jgi:hypothetical protein
MTARGRISWPWGPIGVLVLALTLFGAPAHLEGPVLIPISLGHALSVLDIVALVPLLGAVAWLAGGIWRRRGVVRQRLFDAPELFTAATFLGGAGLGLLIASAFSTFWWWWAVGAAVFGTFLLSAAFAARKKG